MKGYLNKYENQWIVEYWGIDQDEKNNYKTRTRCNMVLDAEDSMYCLDSDRGKEVEFDISVKDDSTFAKLKKNNSNLQDFKKVKNKTRNPIRFELSEKQEKQYEKWKKKLPKISEGHFGMAGGGYWFKFIPTGIGTVVIAGRDDCPDHDINLTDYDTF